MKIQEINRLKKNNFVVQSIGNSYGRIINVHGNSDQNQKSTRLSRSKRRKVGDKMPLTEAELFEILEGELFDNDYCDFASGSVNL